MEIVFLVIWQLRFEKNYQQILFKDEFSLRALYLSETIPWAQLYAEACPPVIWTGKNRCGWVKK